MKRTKAPTFSYLNVENLSHYTHASFIEQFVVSSLADNDTTIKDGHYNNLFALLVEKICEEMITNQNPQQQQSIDSTILPQFSSTTTDIIRFQKFFSVILSSIISIIDENWITNYGVLIASTMLSITSSRLAVDILSNLFPGVPNARVFYYNASNVAKKALAENVYIPQQTDILLTYDNVGKYKTKTSRAGKKNMPVYPIVTSVLGFLLLETSSSETVHFVPELLQASTKYSRVTWPNKSSLLPKLIDNQYYMNLFLPSDSKRKVVFEGSNIRYFDSEINYLEREKNGFLLECFNEVLAGMTESGFDEVIL